MRNPLHKSDTGSFQELDHASNVKFGQLSVLTIAPRCDMGGHYHTHKHEWFCCLRGRCRLLINDIRDGRQETILLRGDRREFVEVKPYENHTVENTSKTDECELLIIVSREYNPADPDTHRLGDKESKEKKGC